jgi:protein-tyrosine phosphatase
MIDLHLHLLPAIDDGAASLDVSVAMLERATQLEFSTLVATPHLDGPLSTAYEAKVRTALSEVIRAAKGMPIAIELGYEIMLSPDLPARLAAGERSRIAGSTTVLVEIPFVGWPIYTEQTLFDIQTQGLRPLLAHPERYSAAQQEPEKVLTLAERGVLLQVTLGSLTGLFGKPAQRLAELLLREGAVAILATDAHSAGHRFTAVEDGLQAADAIVGPDLVRQLTYDNPKALLESRPLPPPAARPIVEESGRGWKKALARATSRLRS